MPGAPQARCGGAGRAPGASGTPTAALRREPSGKQALKCGQAKPLCLWATGPAGGGLSHQAAAHVQRLTADFPPSRLISPLRKARARGAGWGRRGRRRAPFVRSSSPAPGRRVTPGHPARLEALIGKCNVQFGKLILYTRVARPCCRHEARVPACVLAMTPFMTNGQATHVHGFALLSLLSPGS